MFIKKICEEEGFIFKRQINIFQSVFVKRQRAGTGVYTADPKLKSIWPNLLFPVLRIRIHMFLSLLDPNPDPSITKQ